MSYRPDQAPGGSWGVLGGLSALLGRVQGQSRAKRQARRQWWDIGTLRRDPASRSASTRPSGRNPPNQTKNQTPLVPPICSLGRGVGPVPPPPLSPAVGLCPLSHSLPYFRISILKAKSLRIFAFKVRRCFRKEIVSESLLWIFSANSKFGPFAITNHQSR